MALSIILRLIKCDLTPSFFSNLSLLDMSGKHRPDILCCLTWRFRLSKVVGFSFHQDNRLVLESRIHFRETIWLCGHKKSAVNPNPSCQHFPAILLLSPGSMNTRETFSSWQETRSTKLYHRYHR